MAAEVSADLTVIHDEDVLRHMWQQTDDFGRKKEIRQRMYKLREQRLKDFYTDGDENTIGSVSVSVMAGRKHAAPGHADSLDQESVDFVAHKTKEIRDSESPTRDIHRRGDNKYWNTVQQSSYSDTGDDGDLRHSYERSSTGTGRSEDGRTQAKMEADERGFSSSKTAETEGGKTMSNMQQHDAHIATAEKTKTDNGESQTFSTSSEHQEKSSSVTESKTGSSSHTSSKWQSSSSSSSSRKVISSSAITSAADTKMIMADDMDCTDNSRSIQEDVDTSTIRRTKNLNQDSHRYQVREVNDSTNNQVDSNSFIEQELRNNIKNTMNDASIDIRDKTFTDSNRESKSTYTTKMSSNVNDYTTDNKVSTSKRVTQDTNADSERGFVAVDQNIMTEINKLDSYLSTQNTGTNTPASPRSVVGDANWTVVSNTDGEFVYRDDKSISSPGSRVAPIKHPDNLDLPKENTEGQYVTTYNEHYTNKRISVDVSPTHDKFARSLRQSPPGTPRSSSRQSLDRSSPERKMKSSPRASPVKDRRTSVGSYTVERPSNLRRKSSDASRQTGSSPDSSLKGKRKFSTTQAKAAAKHRSSTPGTSPSTSPVRKQKEPSDSSSASDSDASQITYDKKSLNSSHTRVDVVRKNLMNSYEKESPTKDTESIDTVTRSPSRPSSPEKCSSRKNSYSLENKNTGILRKDTRSDSRSTITSVTEHKVPSGIAPQIREKSPEYSSEGSVSKEIKQSQSQRSPDSSPERAVFSPIKQFRTSPEITSNTIQLTSTETNQKEVSHRNTDFIKHESADSASNIEATKNQVNKRTSSPSKEGTTKTPTNQSKREHMSSPTNTESQKNEGSSLGKRTQSPDKDTKGRRPSLPHRSQSPQKDQQRSVSPTKSLSKARKPSVPSSRSPSPTKSRSPSPPKKDTSRTTSNVRKSSLKKESSYNAPPPTRRSSRQGTPSPVKDIVNMYPSISKSPTTRSSSPEKTKSPSPQRISTKRTRQEISSPSVSPCSSPERNSGYNSDKSKPARKTSSPKATANTRSTRRSSIPRADQSTVRKTVETKIEIRAKPVTKIPSTMSRVNTSKQNIDHKNVRTDSQGSLGRQTVTRTNSSTLNKTVPKSKEPAKKSPAPTRTVTTTAVISLSRPTVTSQTRHSSTHTTSRTTASVVKRSSSKEITTKKDDVTGNKKSSTTTSTNRVASKTSTTNEKPTNRETDRSSFSPSPERSIAKEGQCESFIVNEKDSVHGFKGETIHIEISENENNLENETRPELYPDTEDDEITDNQNTTNQNTSHLTEKHINVDSKRKSTSQFVVTIKKPTGTSTPKAATKPVTMRSSSGPVRGTTQATSKTQTTKTITNNRQTATVQKAESLNLIRTNDRNAPKNSVPRRQTSKPEILNVKSQQSPGQNTETGIASRNVTTAKSATIKRNVQQQKKTIQKQTKTDSIYSSHSEDEDENIPSVVTPNQQEQQYIEELDEMRRNEELEYASKLTATKNQDNQLLSVIIQHPKSSRESSPDYSNRSHPYAVSDDGSSNPRYADLISEPEDLEILDSKTTDGPKLNRLAHNDSRFEQVTDLDEEPDVSDFTLDVSVADRVSHFLETSRTHINSTPSREELEPINSTDSPKTVLKAKAMFETISKNHQAPPAPGNKPVDILSRPSVFEARRGQIEPKPVSSDTLSETESPEPEVLRRGSIRVEYQEKQAERAEAKQYNEARISIKESTTLRTQTQSPTKDVLASKTTTEKREDRTSDRSATQVKVAPNNQSITNPTHSKRDTNSMPDKTQKNAPKAKPFERMISATAEISSKRAFFENKSQSHTPKNNLKSDSPAKERKPLTDSIQNKENIRGQSPTRKTSRSSPERKMSTPSPVKERKTSLKSESPERRISLTKSVKERRSSFTKEDITVGQTSVIQKKDSFSKEPIGRKVSPSRAPITQKNFPDHSPSSTVLKTSPAQSTPRSPVKDRKPSFPGEPAESPTRRKSSRSSPVRLTKSPERSSPSPTNENEPVELNKARKFGVTLRRTSSTTSAGTPRRTSIPGETQEVEDVTDVALLEIMMEKAVGYEQRRRIRSQIREVKKKEEESRATAKGTGRRTSPTRDYKPSTKAATPTAAETERPERRRASSPTKKSPERQTTTEPQSQRRQSQPAADQRTKRPASPTKSAGTRPQAQSPTDAPGGRRSPAHRPTTTTSTSPSARSTAADTETTTAQVTTTTTTVRTQKRTETLVESAGVDCITSSYGVGPTDETGRPLFGLRALRRSNTNKQLTDAITDEPEVRAAEPAVSEPVCDGRGRPLFGGLKALRAIDTSSDDMPEQKTSAQLRQLVQHHEKVVKETNGPQDQPRQKPKARLRDNYVTQEEEQMTGSHLTEVTNLNRGLSLRSIIQKHENISNSPGDVRSEMESSHTVVSSRTAVSSNGSVSVKEDFIRGDISSKNGGEPVGKVTRTQFTYQSPEGDDKGVNKITTSTATIGGRRTSGPRITEIEDVQDSPSRKSSLKSSSKTSTVTERTFSRKGSSPSEYEDSRKTERLTSEDRITSSGVTSTDDSKRKISSRQTESRGNAASPTLRRQKSTEEEPVVEEKRKTVVRGDSVRALQHKFQQATENAANSVARSQASRTGLILRTSSFKTPSASAQSQNTVSSTLKQSTILSADKKNGRQSPDKGRQESPVNDTTTAHREATDITSRGDSVTKRTGETSSTSSRVTETTTTSFLDNTSRVTGVQDILTRMRNADLVGESGDTDADREARALLNKFLGASVILQGMEQGMRAPLPEGTPDSAALVRSVEKQRKAGTNVADASDAIQENHAAQATTKQKEEDIENIWDEQVLKTLLEQCTDYEGRRTLRARLRTVMAQHKACSDLVAATGAGSNSSEHAESESKQVTTRTDGGTVTRTEVHTKTSTNRLTKANSVAASPFAKFRQLERQNSAPSVGQATPLYKITDPRVARSASTIKDRLLSWVQAQTREYKNIQIENFSTSWNNGLAFCALIHHFCPEAFDYDKLTPEQRRHNFELAFRVAEEEADIAPLLDVEDMVVMRRPDWKCVFTYVQSVYRRFHSTPEAVRC